MVGSHIRARPRPSPRARRPAEPGMRETSSPSKRRARTDRQRGGEEPASKRRGRIGGVTHRDSGTSRSVRSLQVEMHRRSRGRSTSPPSSAARACRGRGGRRIGEQHAGLLERLADRGDVGGQRRVGDRSPPSAAAASAGETDRPRDERWVGVSRVHPATREHVDVGGERHRRRPSVSSTSGPAGPGRSSTTVAAGRGSTGSVTGRARRVADAGCRAGDRVSAAMLRPPRPAGPTAPRAS